MLIAQISDTHIPLKGKKTYGIAPMAENLVQCIADINQQNPKPSTQPQPNPTQNDFLNKLALNMKEMHDMREKLIFLFLALWL